MTTEKLTKGYVEFDKDKAFSGEYDVFTKDGKEVRLSFISDLKDNYNYPILGWIKNTGLQEYDSESWDFSGSCGVVERNNLLLKKKKKKLYIAVNPTKEKSNDKTPHHLTSLAYEKLDDLKAQPIHGYKICEIELEE